MKTITVSNYNQIVTESIVPKQLKTDHETVKSMLDLYDEDKEIKDYIDLYIKKLSGCQPPATRKSVQRWGLGWVQEGSRHRWPVLERPVAELTRKLDLALLGQYGLDFVSTEQAQYRSQMGRVAAAIMGNRTRFEQPDEFTRKQIL